MSDARVAPGPDRLAVLFGLLDLLRPSGRSAGRALPETGRQRVPVAAS